MRNCFDCPICTSPLATSFLHPDSDKRAVSRPWILSCGYCNWSSLDIGWQFETNKNMHQQVSKLKAGQQPKSISTTPADFAKPIGSEPPSEAEPTSASLLNKDPDAAFSTVRSFYSSQLSASNPADPLLTPSGGFNYSSPSSLARIMSLYTGRSFGKKDTGKSRLMRESANVSEGLNVTDLTCDDEAIRRLRIEGWTATASVAQKSEQRHAFTFTDDLRPMGPLLRTKRSKRCRACRHLLVRPEQKVQSTRFRIRLVALNYIPTMSLKPLQPSPSTGHPLINLKAILPLRPSQFLLTLKNPLFDAVKVTLATPVQTPGRYSHKVTVLCPDFDIGSNIDQWDEALGDEKSRRSSKLHSLSKVEYAGGDGGRVAEAGKVWEKGRNWTTVVVEVVCANVAETRDLEEDEDVLEIPIFVRMEWEADLEREGKDEAKGEKKEKRELAYWTVVGVGRVGQL